MIYIYTLFFHFALCQPTTFTTNSGMQGLCGIRRLAVREGLVLFLSEATRWELLLLNTFHTHTKKLLNLSILFQDAQSAINDLTGTYSPTHFRPMYSCIH